MNDNGIFRKVSLDRLASPEQLDQLLPLTDRKGWLALLALGLIIAGAAAWSVVGTLPQNVTGTGILVTRAGVLEVAPAVPGKVDAVLTRVGDMVKAGQVVVRLAQPDLVTRLAQTKGNLADLIDQQKQMVTNDVKDAAVQRRQLAQQRVAAQRAIKSAINVARAAEEKIETQAPLVKAGLLLRQTLLETKQRKDSALERIEEGHSQLAQITARETELYTKREEDQAAGQRKIGELRRLLGDLTRELRDKTEIVSTGAGRVLEVVAEPGQVVGAGQALLTLDASGGKAGDLEAVIFVPSTQGKQIRLGMSVLIAPATIKQEEFGMMVGRVTSVSDFPTTIKGMQRILKNDKLVASLSGNDAPYEVRAELTPDATTPSKYRWSSSQGPAQRIEGGSLAEANIAVTHRRPIDLLIPILRERTGL